MSIHDLPQVNSRSDGSGWDKKKSWLDWCFGPVGSVGSDGKSSGIHASVLRQWFESDCKQSSWEADECDLVLGSTPVEQGLVDLDGVTSLGSTSGGDVDLYLTRLLPIMDQERGKVYDLDLWSKPEKPFSALMLDSSYATAVSALWVNGTRYEFPKKGVVWVSYESETVVGLELTREIVSFGYRVLRLPHERVGPRLAGSVVRASAPASLSVVGPDQIGYCYLRAVRPDRYHTVSALGPGPSLKSLVNLPLSVLADRSDLVKLRLSVFGRAAHLGDEGIPFIDVLESVSGRLGIGQWSDERVAMRAGRFFDKRAHFVSPEVVVGVQVPAGVEVIGKLADRGMVVSSSDGFWHDMALVSKSAAMHENEGKQRLRILEACGDAVLTHSLARACLNRGVMVQTYQSARSACTNNAALSALFVSKFELAAFSFPSGVHPGVGNVGAKTLEAMLGVVDLHYGYDAAEALIRSLEIFGLASAVVQFE